MDAIQKMRSTANRGIATTRAVALRVSVPSLRDDNAARRGLGDGAALSDQSYHVPGVGRLACACAFWKASLPGTRILGFSGTVICWGGGNLLITKPWNF